MKHDTDPQRTFMAKQAGVEPDADWDTIHEAMHAKAAATMAALSEQPCNQMLQSLRDEWGTLGIVTKTLEPLTHEEAYAVLRQWMRKHGLAEHVVDDWTMVTPPSSTTDRHHPIRWLRGLWRGVG